MASVFKITLGRSGVVKVGVVKVGVAKVDVAAGEVEIVEGEGIEEGTVDGPSPTDKMGLTSSATGMRSSWD